MCCCIYVKVHETRSSAAGSEDQKMTRRKHKTDNTSHDSGENATKKAKSDNGSNGKLDRENIAAEFEKFCKEISDQLSIEQMRKILEANGRGWTGSDDAVVPRWLV